MSERIGNAINEINRRWKTLIYKNGKTKRNEGKKGEEKEQG